MSSRRPDSYGQAHDRQHDVEDYSMSAMLLDSEDDISLGLDMEITAWQRMLSATTGSLVSGLLVTPLDVVRVRWQSQTSQSAAPTPNRDISKMTLKAPTTFRPSDLGLTACCREVFSMNNESKLCVVGPKEGGLGHNSATSMLPRAGFDCAVEETQQKTFTSTLDGLRKIARNEGLPTLWRGLAPTLAMAVPGNIIYFTGYEWLRYSAQSPFRRMGDQYAPLVAGSMARIVAAAVVSPIELFRTRLQAATGTSTTGYVRDTIHGIRDMINVHGYRSLWRGLTLTLWRDVPFSGMYWWSYEAIRARLTDARMARGDGATDESNSLLRRKTQSSANHQDTFTDSFIAGAVSGAVASVATMPFDVGKTRMQVYQDSARSVGAGGTRAAVASAAAEQRMSALLRSIYETEGMAGLFKGWIPRTLKVAPACAIMISSYEVGKLVFRGSNRKRMEKRLAEQ